MSQKQARMAKMNLQHLQYESDGWKRFLEFTRAENGFLLARLSTIARQNGEASFLTHAEFYQNLFVEQDEKIRSLRESVDEFDRMLLIGVYANGQWAGKTSQKYNQLKDRIEREEKEFRELKLRFDQYVSTM